MILAFVYAAMSSQVRSRVRYQLSPPVNPAALELVHIEVHIGSAQPRRQGVWILHQVEELGRPRLGRTGGRLTGAPVEHSTDGRPDVLLELGFGNSGSLEIEHVVKIVSGRQPESVRRPDHAS